jgi:uncharacterized protein YgiM (DUF1202 family)
MKKLGKALILTTSIITGAAGITFSPIKDMKIEASSSIAITKTSFQTNTSLNIRSGAGASYKTLYTIPKGKIVSATEKNGSWYKVSYTYSSKGKNTTKTGWVNGYYLKEYNQFISTTKDYYISNRTANLYPVPNTSQKYTYTVSINNGFYSTQKVVNSIGQTWYRVTFNGKTLYINSSYVTKSSFVSFSSTKYKAVKDTSIYQGYGNAYKKLKTIPKGTIVTSLGKMGSWYAISYGGAAGYVNSADFSKYTPITYKTTNTNTTYYFTNKTAKLYPSADLLQSATYSVPSSTGFASSKRVVNSLGQTWYEVSYNGKVLYVQSIDASSDTPKTITKIQLKANQNTVVYQSYGSVFKALATIPKNAIITASQKINNWYSVSYGGSTGYVYSTNFSLSTPVTYQDTNTSPAYYFTNKTAALYSSPDTNSAAVATIGANNGFISAVIGTNNENNDKFYKVSFNNQSLYVKSTDVTSMSFNSFTSASFQAKIDTYVYQSYGNAFTKLIKIPKGTVLNFSKKINSWYSVSYGGQTGYAYSGDFSNYTPPVTEQAITPTTFDTTTALNIRKAADASTDLLATIPGSTIVIASAKTSNNWYKVTFNGKTGYASGSYLKQVITGDPLTSHDGYQFIDLRTHSNVTAAEINNYIASYVKSTGKASILTGKGQAFIDAGSLYGVNALYLAAHAIHESAFGTSTIALAKNNLFGYHAYDADPFIAAYKFASVEDCINYAARIIKINYLTPTGSYYKTPILGFKTTDMGKTRIDVNSIGMNFYYASDQNWGKTIAQHMQNILSYNKSDYANAQPDKSVPAYPGIPVSTEVFPPGVTAIAKKDLTLNTAKGKLDNVKTLNSGSSFIFLEKTNDDWVELQVGGQTYWTHDINFYTYKSCLSVKNLGRAIQDLNVRSGPGTSYANIKDKNSNDISIDPTDYISINLNKDGTLAMDSSKQWYNITLANGQIGWVSAKYIAFELQ